MELKELMTRAFVEAVPQRAEGETAFLDAVEEEDLRRAYFICLILRMPLDELKKMKEEKKTAEEIDSRRNEFIVKLATDLDPMAHRMSAELSRLNDLIEQNHEATNFLKRDVAEAIERERNTLLDQISGLKEQQKRDQALAMQYREDIRAYQEKLEVLMKNSRVVPKEEPSTGKKEPSETLRNEAFRNSSTHTERAGLFESRRRKRRQEECEQEMDEFIRELISKEDLSKEQKDYLLSALEEGYSFKVARRVMVPTLTVEQMQKFIKIYDRRMGGKKK